MLLIIVTFSALVLLSAGKTVESSSQLCYQCHEMRPEIYLTKVSTHARLSCFDCHFTEKISGAALLSLVPMLQAKMQETYYLPITSKTPISSKVCESCHNMLGREATPSLDLIIPHKEHQAKKVPCLSCHSGLVHNQIASRELTIEADWEKWSPEYAKKVQKKIHYSVSMDGCIECHKKKKVILSCGGCHREIRPPEDHLQGDWEIKHGRLAALSYPDCNKCHRDGIPVELRTTPFNLKDYVQVNKFCRTCHLQKPKGHQGDWRRVHGAVSKERDCEVCHLPKTSTEKKATVSCIECHKNSHGKPGPFHPVTIERPLDFIKCRGCHIVDGCGKCHQV